MKQKRNLVIFAAIRTCRKRLIYTAALLAAALLFRLFRHNRALMNFMTASVAYPLRDFFASICSFTRWSVAEWMVAAAALFAAGLAAAFLFRLIFRRQPVLALVRFFSAAAAASLTVSTLLTLLWNVSYHADTFQQKSGIVPRESGVEELAAATEMFAEKLAAESGNILRDENNLFAEDIDGLFDLSVTAFDPLTEEFPFLSGPNFRSKKVLFSRAMSLIETTGIAFPFTGEANINIDQPRAWIPATITHEIAHQRRVASEQDANFIAVLACDRSPHPSYRYSGYLLAYSYLAAALSREDYDRYLAIASALPDGVLADLDYNRRYWRQFDGTVSDISRELYDGYLKGQGQEMGRKSYGAVVDMLIAYYL